MDIDLLSKMVYDLILEHDRVALPGLGCFVAEVVPASFSDRGYTINPPYRKLFFRNRPDDGELLVRLYSRSNGVSEEDARAILTDFISEMREVLFSRKVIVFPGLGRLRATKENNVFFVADENLDIYPDGFGLQPLSLKTRRETGQEIADKVSELDDIMNSGQPSGEPVPEAVVAAETPEPAPAVEPEETFQEEVAAEATPESVPAEAPLKEPVPETPEPQEQASAVEPEGTSPEATPVSEPETVTSSAPEAVASEPEAAASAPEAGASAENTPHRKSSRKVLVAVLAVVLTVAVLLAAFVLVARLRPDFTDRLLYTQEELDIINYNL